MNSETVHLASPPTRPFNKNRDFHATPDSLAAGARFGDRWSWERDVHEEWTDNIKDDWPVSVSPCDCSSRAESYRDEERVPCCWACGMEMVRLRRGAVRLASDPFLRFHHYSSMLDAIFGRISM